MEIALSIFTQWTIAIFFQTICYFLHNDPMNFTFLKCTKRETIILIAEEIEIAKSVINFSDFYFFCQNEIFAELLLRDDNAEIANNRAGSPASAAALVSSISAVHGVLLNTFTHLLRHRTLFIPFRSSKTSSRAPLREQTHQGLSLFISNLCYETHFYIESTFRESISIAASLKTSNYTTTTNPSLWAVKKSSSDGAMALMLHVIDSGDQLSSFMNGDWEYVVLFFTEKRVRVMNILHDFLSIDMRSERARAQARWEVEVQRSNLLIVGMKWKGELEL